MNLRRLKRGPRHPRLVQGRTSPTRALDPLRKSRRTSLLDKQVTKRYRATAGRRVSGEEAPATG